MRRLRGAAADRAGEVRDHEEVAPARALALAPALASLRARPLTGDVRPARLRGAAADRAGEVRDHEEVAPARAADARPPRRIAAIDTEALVLA